MGLLRQLVDIYLALDEYIVALIISLVNEWLSNKWHEFNPLSYRIVITPDREIADTCKYRIYRGRVDKLAKLARFGHFVLHNTINCDPREQIFNVIGLVDVFAWK